MTMFPLLRVLSDNPPTEALTGIVFNAPRPLIGDLFACDLMGFTVVITDDRYRRGDAVDENRRMDAKVVVWVSKAEALHDAYAYVVREYDQDTADEADEDTLLDVWAHTFRTGTVDVG